MGAFCFPSPFYSPLPDGSSLPAYPYVSHTFVRIVRPTQGIGRDGRTLKQPMARQVYFAKMTDADKKGHPPF